MGKVGEFRFRLGGMLWGNNEESIKTLRKSSEDLANSA
jgi:hypothetical protein